MTECCPLSSLETLEEELNTDHSSPMSLTGVGEGEFCVAKFPLNNRWGHPFLGSETVWEWDSRP